MNSVNIIGRLTADPELKYTPAGVALCNLRIAVKDPFAKGDQPTADFFDVAVWRETAEHVAEYLKKGREVAITGRLKVHEWKTEAGEKRSRINIQADRVTFIGGGGDGQKKGGGGAEPSDDNYGYDQ